MKIAPKSPHCARSWRGLEIFLTETQPTDALKHLFRPLSPRNPFFPALRSGHRLFQRPSRQKQIPSNDAPIMQWLPVIEQIQRAGKGVIVDLQPAELEPFIAATRPEGLYLCIPAEENIQPDILRRLEKW
jgi:hypothetical protein